jgi:uncharacterized membrane protein
MNRVLRARRQPILNVPVNQRSISPAILGYAAGALIGLGWIWAATLLATRHHLTASYGVISTAPLLWGSVGLPASSLVFAIGVGVCLAIMCGHAVRTQASFWILPVRWLMCSWLIPGLDLLRLFGAPIPMTFLEALLLAGITGAAAGELADVFFEKRQPCGRGSASIWFLAIGTLAILCCGWWYFDGQRAYDNYLLGYNDFGHFGRRIANTWEGRGFLLESPELPAFWDHFNPGLALLAPLWGMWPDPRLFVLIQAICLAAPALIVFGIARQLGAGSAAAATWAVAYLVFPAVGQLNLNYSYGWHPVSLALPLLFLAVWALLRSRRILALLAALLACSFQEDIIVVSTCFALAMALDAWLRRHYSSGSLSQFPSLPADALPAWAWLVVAGVLGLAFVVIFKLAPFSKFQTDRFAALGKSPDEILLSPVIRPGVFWSTILRPRCGYFLGCLMIPLGLRTIVRGWPILLAAVLPLGVLLGWDHLPATSIAFQYTSGLTPVLFLAAMVGAALAGQLSPTAQKAAPNDKVSHALWCTGVAALLGGATASVAIGALPWSSPTLTDVVSRTYLSDSSVRTIDDRVVDSPGNDILNQSVARVGGKQSAVLATGRIAAHLLAVRRLDTVGQACSRWKDIGKGNKNERSAIEQFDWIVLDTKERFYQSQEQVQVVIAAANRAGYRLVQSEHGILILTRPLAL